MLSKIDNHAELALARVAEQYKKSTRINGIIESVADQWQEVDDALWQLATERYLFSDAEIGGVTVNYEAEGVQLDVIGALLDETRGAYSDDEYRLILKGKIKLLKSSGTAENLIDIFATCEPDATITVQTWPPAYVTVTLSDVITATDAGVYVRFIRDGRAAGVAGTLLWQETADAGCLILYAYGDADPNGDGVLDTDTSTGLGDATDPTTGGALTGAAG
jgi:hypothetical protein